VGKRGGEGGEKPRREGRSGRPKILRGFVVNSALDREGESFFGVNASSRRGGEKGKEGSKEDSWKKGFTSELGKNFLAGSDHLRGRILACLETRGRASRAPDGPKKPAKTIEGDDVRRERGGEL